MANTKKRRRGNSNRAGKMCISLIVLAFGVVMSIQIYNVYQKNEDYAARQEVLEQQLQDEIDRQEEIEEYEAYTQSQDYVEDVAQGKLGLLYDNQIVFREEEP